MKLTKNNYEDYLFIDFTLKKDLEEKKEQKISEYFEGLKKLGREKKKGLFTKHRNS